MTTIGQLTDELPEPMKREDFERAQKAVRACWDGTVNLDRKDVQRMLDEIRWLKRRLRRVESVVEPLIEALLPPESQKLP